MTSSSIDRLLPASDGAVVLRRRRADLHVHRGARGQLFGTRIHHAPALPGTVLALAISVIGLPLGRALVPPSGGALRPSMSLVAAVVTAVHVASITPPADEEEPNTEPADGQPQAVVHESPEEHAGNLSS